MENTHDFENNDTILFLQFIYLNLINTNFEKFKRDDYN